MATSTRFQVMNQKIKDNLPLTEGETLAHHIGYTNIDAAVQQAIATPGANVVSFLIAYEILNTHHYYIQSQKKQFDVNIAYFCNALIAGILNGSTIVEMENKDSMFINLQNQYKQ